MSVPEKSKLVAEMVGTFFLVLVVFGNVVGGTGPAFTALSIASVLMVMIYALGDISGAHLNPAVSVAISLVNQQKWITTGCYIGAQLVGALLAAGLAVVVFGYTFDLAPASGHSWMQAGFAEILYTAMLSFVVLNVAVAKANAGNVHFGLAIGYVIVAGGYAVGGISGANFNPAVSLAIDLSGLSLKWSLAYVIFQLMGAAVGAGLFKLVRPEEVGGAKPVGILEKLASEFLGTFYLVLTVGCSVELSAISAAFAIAGSLMVMIYALGSVSGAHFNPAVTFAIYLSGRGKHPEGPTGSNISGQYVAAQILGGVAGALTYAALTGSTFPLGAPATAGLLETLFTFVLCFVVLAVATSQKPSKDFFGLAIGSCVTVGGFAAGAVGGGVLNPAAAIGIETANAVVSKGKWLDCLGYSMLELTGAGLAAGVFSQTYSSEYSK